MIKIVKAVVQRDRLIGLTFSDGSCGEYDLEPLIQRDTPMVRPLRDEQFFRRHFLELGALCWPNGLELSADSLQRKLRDAGLLRAREQVA